MLFHVSHSIAHSDSKIVGILREHFGTLLLNLCALQAEVVDCIFIALAVLLKLVYSFCTFY